MEPKPSSLKTIREIPHPPRDVTLQDAPIGMELGNRDKAVLGQLFHWLGMLDGIMSEVRQDPIDNKYLGRIIENIAVQIRDIERELDEFARDFGYE